MNAALGLLTIGPAAGACIVAWIGAARAGHAADRRKTLAGKWMPRQVPILEHRDDLGGRDARERIEFQPRAFNLNRRNAGALAALKAFAAIDPGIEAGQRLAERLDLAQIATGIGIGGPEIARCVLRSHRLF